MDKRVASKVLKSLDDTASTLEVLAKDGSLNPRQAAESIRNIDIFADKLEVAAYGIDNLKARQAKVLQQDKDEPYMKTFENPNKPIEVETDEPYMHKTGPTFTGKGVDTFDQDKTTTVSERDEYAVRDLSSHSDATKRQPSWARGPAGKSTKAG